MKVEHRSMLWMTTSPWPLCTSTLTLRWSPIGPKRQDKATVDCITVASWVWGSHNTKQRTEMVWAPRIHCEFWLWWHPQNRTSPSVTYCGWKYHRAAAKPVHAFPQESYTKGSHCIEWSDPCVQSTPQVVWSHDKQVELAVRRWD